MHAVIVWEAMFLPHKIQMSVDALHKRARAAISFTVTVTVTNPQQPLQAGNLLSHDLHYRNHICNFRLITIHAVLEHNNGFCRQAQAKTLMLPVGHIC